MLEIPPEFMTVPYKGVHYPGAPHVVGIQGGANCQQFAYTLLRYFGFDLPNFRSSHLWEDNTYTKVVRGPFRELDILLWNRTHESYGAHVGLYLGEGYALHLAQSVGLPVIWPLDTFLERPEYQVFLGAKRPSAFKDKDRSDLQRSNALR